MYLQIDTSMTIHMDKGEQKSLSKNNKKKDERSLLKEDIVPLMLKGDVVDAQWGFGLK
jgi:hypothetical protein